MEILGFQMMKSVFFVFTLFLILFIPTKTEAGFFSFVEVFFGNTVVKVEEIKDTNSQNMTLLQAVANTDPNPSKGGGGITIIGDQALLPDTSPSGTLTQAEEGSLSSDQISIYVVRDGDSLSQIAKMFGVSINTIIWANNIRRSSLIKEGQTLVILPVSGIQHTVKKGDTLKKIAKKYKGNLTEIKDYNGITPKQELAVGQVIVIPDGEISTPKYSFKKSYKKVRGTNVPSYRGYYMRPLRGGIKSQGLHGYNAVDIAAPKGTSIFASASGKVIISRFYGWNGGYGQYVVIKHPNGTQTLYAHLSRNAVKAGRTVVKGQVIGYVGTTGRSTGNHLHFEIRGAKNPF